MTFELLRTKPHSILFCTADNAILASCVKTESMPKWRILWFCVINGSPSNAEVFQEFDYTHIDLQKTN